MRKYITPIDVLKSIKKVIETDSSIFIPSFPPQPYLKSQKRDFFLDQKEKKKIRTEAFLAKKYDVCNTVKKEIRTLTITQEFSCLILKLHCHYNTLPLFIQTACQELVKNKYYKNHPRYAHAYNCISEIFQAYNEYSLFNFREQLQLRSYSRPERVQKKEIQDSEVFFYNLARKHGINSSWLDDFPVKKTRHDLFAHFFVYPYIITKAPYI